MLLNRESDYAVRCVLEIALNGQLPISEIAQRNDISPSFLGNIVSVLVRAGIVVARRGAGGGIALARPAEEITVLEIVEAMQGPLALNLCLDPSHQCPRRPACPASAVFANAQRVLRQSLRVNLVEVLRSPPEPQTRRRICPEHTDVGVAISRPPAPKRRHIRPEAVGGGDRR